MLAEKVRTAKVVLGKLKTALNKYTDSHKLSELPPYTELQTKDNIGSIYRADQVHYEKLNEFRTKYNGIVAILTNYKAENTDRMLKRQIDSLIDIANAEIATLTNMIFTAKDRVRFYQNMIYLISNMTYGDY